jgi:hypothetical protein
MNLLERAIGVVAPRVALQRVRSRVALELTMPTAANLLELYLRVIPALPMQYEAYRLAFTGGDNLFQSDTKKAFLMLRQTVWIIPEAAEQREPWLWTASSRHPTRRGFSRIPPIRQGRTLPFGERPAATEPATIR